MLPLLLDLIFQGALVLGDNSTGYDHDPILSYRPPFARSLPVQILLTGIVLTLVVVLFIHLVFTGQYHWPLAPVNYVLQMSGVTTLLISLIATLHVVLSATVDESTRWPYMLSYIAVNVPPLTDLDTDSDRGTWSTAERATWLIMNATTSALIQITHIQFLTLLYPSKLEGRLIFSLLGPMAITASIAQLVPIQTSNDNLNSIASAVRNVCNATLSLLFTASLFIWGFLVNRSQAWRTDGGTAAFGCAALVLAIFSTALTFLYVPREVEYVWLPGLMWSVVLWQSFLGWWWWVGAGSGAHAGSRREGRTEASSTAVQTHTTHTSENQNNRTRRRNAPSSLPSVASSNDTLPTFLPAVIHRWYHLLRRAHQKAARQQTVEREAMVRQRGWGLGSFAFREQDQQEQEQSQDDQAAQSKPKKEKERSWLSRWRLQDSTVYS